MPTNHFPPRGDIPPQQRIRDRVAVMPDGCWIWLGHIDKQGYGKMGVGTTPWLSHRFSFEAFRGAIPEGLQLDHVVCDEPSCCNPWHVEPRTMWENVSRAPEWNGNKTHCKHGHEFTIENTHRTADGRRQCRACRRIAGRELYWSKRSARKRSSRFGLDDQYPKVEAI